MPTNDRSNSGQYIENEKKKIKIKIKRCLKIIGFVMTMKFLPIFPSSKYSKRAASNVIVIW